MIFSEVRPQSNSTPRELPNSFGVYIHVPYCIHRCSYCDFFSLTQYQESDFEKLVDHLLAEATSASEWLHREGRVPALARSVFIGGGTPSLLPVGTLNRLLRGVLKLFPTQPDAEITSEANPETVTDDFCRALLSETPINRVSLGAQSFSEKNLSLLERRCSPRRIGEAVASLNRAGLTNYNLDLIFGIPGQTHAALCDDIRAAAALGPNHISFYNLTLKPGHTLFKSLPSDDEAADQYEVGVMALADLGYAQYEISNFAQPGKESRHNLLYWQGGDYLGLGPSAATRFFWDNSFHHRKQYSDLGKYFANASFPSPGFETCNREQTILEATFLEMRTNDGVDLPSFRRRYDYDLTSSSTYPLYLREGLLERSANRLRLTARGRLLADRITRDLSA